MPERGQPGIIKLNVADRAALYQAYMPFISNGGLFIPTSRRDEDKRYNLGDEVFLLVHLEEQGESMPVPGKIVWVTPPGAQSQRVPGVGIQFATQDGGATQQKIETLLAGSINSERPTHTL